MVTKEKIAIEFLNFWNSADIKSCEQMLDDNVELRSTYALKIFPDSQGVFRSKKSVVNYMNFIAKEHAHIKLKSFVYKLQNDCVIIKSKSTDNENNLSYYVHYCINENDRIYLIKTDVSEKLG